MTLTPHTFIEDPAWPNQCRECKQHRQAVVHRVASMTALARSTRQIIEESSTRPYSEQCPGR